MLTCKDASHLVSHSQDRTLGFRERWELRIHLWMCVNCRRFERQIGLMRRLLRQSARQAEAEAADRQLPAEARERIRQALPSSNGTRTTQPPEKRPSS
ncbi:MAG: zf-HC2 domain-containing protein [Thiobacillus sp.]|nr:zf-HC2 domain-containing protein [Thiobacillus sp.]